MGRTGDAKSCVSTEENCDDGGDDIDIIYWYGLDGRRKILCLYFWGESIIYMILPIHKNDGASL